MITEKNDIRNGEQVDLADRPNRVNHIEKILACDGDSGLKPHGIYDDSEHHHEKVENDIQGPQDRSHEVMEDGEHGYDHHA